MADGGLAAVRLPPEPTGPGLWHPVAARTGAQGRPAGPVWQQDHHHCAPEGRRRTGQALASHLSGARRREGRQPGAQRPLRYPQGSQEDQLSSGQRNRIGPGHY